MGSISRVVRVLVVLVDLRPKECYRQICPKPNAPSASPTRPARETVRIDGPSVAKEAVRRPGLGVPPAKLSDGLTVRQAGPFIRLSYRDTDPERAKEVVGAVGRVAAERITGTGSKMLPPDTELTATVWEPAALPDAPVSPKPLRDGLLTLAVGLALIWGAAEAIPVARRRRAARSRDGTPAS